MLVSVPVYFSTWGEIALTNYTAVYEALRGDPTNGGKEWAGSMGTRRSLARDSLRIDLPSLAYRRHDWIKEAGYVDIELVRNFPSMVAL